jgi:DNA repair protein SbcC/Rad50
MKPLRLILDAVGPFPGRVVIDFADLIRNPLFGIYGPTGAGKSTIFSAMTFALFGEAAKPEQLTQSLRADQADPTHPTEVEFIFENRGQVLRVVRRPAQLRPARRGNGDVEDAAEATLFDVTEMDLSTIDDGNPGRVLAEGRVTTVDKQIVDALGYGAAQFRQIVLLPQGRFEGFLKANTSARLNILRDLFDVSIYRELTERLKADAAAVEKHVAGKREAWKARLALDGFATRDELTSGVELVASQVATQQATWVAVHGTFGTADTAHRSAIVVELNYAEHASAVRACNEVTAAASEFEALQARVDKAEVATRITPFEQAAEAAREEIANAMSLLDASRLAEQQAAATAEAAASQFNVCLKQQPERERYHEDLLVCRGHRTRFEKTNALRIAMADATTSERAATARAAASKASYETAARSAAEAADRARLAQDAARQRADLRAQVSSVTLELQSAERYERVTHQRHDSQAATDRLSADVIASDAIFAESQLAFETAAAALLADHATHVASHLIDGKPCPACGSREHPAPAHGTTVGRTTVEVLARAKAASEVSRAKLDQSRRRLAEAQALFKQSEAELRALEVPARSATVVKGALSELRNALKALGPDVDLDALQAAVVAAHTVSADALAALNVDEAATRLSAQATALARRSLEDALADIPPDLRDGDLLATREALLVGRIEALDMALELARRSERLAANAHLVAAGNSATAAACLSEVTQRCATAEEQVRASLADVGLDLRTYGEAKADIVMCADLKSRIAGHHDRRIRADARLNTAAAAILDVGMPDVAATKAARDDAEAALQHVVQLHAQTKARLRQLEALEVEFNADSKRLDDMEQQSGPLLELAAAFDGRGASKVNLETFAITAMFDRVLEATNMRLDPMTSGRFRLARAEESRGAGKQGLGLVVDDAYTGKQRPAETLSGGETFMAALSLALGLSDVVESANGNIKLDTLLLDEGFGTLDAETDAGTLEQVLDTLQDLVGPNRSVGLISHVPLVQQSVPNGLWISKAATGSRIEVRG